MPVAVVPSRIEAELIVGLLRDNNLTALSRSRDRLIARHGPYLKMTAAAFAVLPTA